MFKPDDFPKLLKVLDEDYRVCFAQKLNEGDLGYCDSDMKLIVLSRCQDMDEMLATFFHEALHAFEFEHGISLGHSRIRKLEYFLVSITKQLLAKDGPNE
jgi:hypothetical protein